MARAGSRQGMADALFDEFWIVRHPSQEDAIPHEVHRAQLHLGFLEETFAGDGDVQHFRLILSVPSGGDGHAQRDQVGRKS